jgi:RNA-binding protein 39
LVLRLHLNAKEKDVFKLFASNNIGRVVDIKIIRDQRSGKSKGVSYVEFESQESVLLAVALTNQQILGKFIIRFNTNIRYQLSHLNKKIIKKNYKKFQLILLENFLVFRFFRYFRFVLAAMIIFIIFHFK